MTRIRSGKSGRRRWQFVGDGSSCNFGRRRRRRRFLFTPDDFVWMTADQFPIWWTRVVDYCRRSVVTWTGRIGWRWNADAAVSRLRLLDSRLGREIDAGFGFRNSFVERLFRWILGRRFIWISNEFERRQFPDLCPFLMGNDFVKLRPIFVHRQLNSVAQCRHNVVIQCWLPETKKQKTIPLAFRLY